MTLNNGARFYLSLRSKERKEVATSDTATPSQGPSGLCGTAYSTLRDQAMLELSKMQSPGAPRELDLGDTAAESHDSGVESMDEDQPQTELWVEKFRPRSYVELLSDDGTNRVLLKWLKLWDKVVFGREVRVRNKNKKDEEEGESNPQKAKNKQQQGKFKKKFVELDIDDELDGSGRPKLKMAMLHGPPGLGKTTLAHVIANHAGYNVVEMNASDDRSLEAFRTKLDSATQMRSVNSKDQRPNCLVIDEIDGAPAPVINHLISIVTGNAGKKSKKAAAKGDGLQRPIICICNDLFVPALRPLRQHCMVVRACCDHLGVRLVSGRILLFSIQFPFPPTLCSRLAQRLGDIAGRQRLRTDTTALIALCEKADNDIRSCLSTLQFFWARGKPLRKDDVQKANVGQKDVEKGHFAVWRELFEVCCVPS